MLELKMYMGVMFDDTEYWCKSWRKTDFILESKMAELNENKNLPDQPDAMWKLCFTMEINSLN